MTTTRVRDDQPPECPHCHKAVMTDARFGDVLADSLSRLRPGEGRDTVCVECGTRLRLTYAYDDSNILWKCTSA